MDEQYYNENPFPDLQFGHIESTQVKVRSARGKGKPYKKKSESQLLLLNSYYKENPFPEREEVREIELKTGLTYNEIRRWYRDKRYVVKNEKEGSVEKIPVGENENQNFDKNSSNIYFPETRYFDNFSNEFEQSTSKENDRKRKRSNETENNFGEYGNQENGEEESESGIETEEENDGIIIPGNNNVEENYKVNENQNDQNQNQNQNQNDSRENLEQVDQTIQKNQIQEENNNNAIKDNSGNGQNQNQNQKPKVKTTEKRKRRKKVDPEKVKECEEKCLGSLSSLPTNSIEKLELLKKISSTLSTAERIHLRELLHPKKPYRGSSFPLLSPALHARRAKESWSELEMIFGVQKNEPSIELQEKDLQEKDVREKSTGSLLNQDMVIGLRHMFRYHRDYLYVVAKDLSVSGLPNYDQKEIESERSKSNESENEIENEKKRYVEENQEMYVEY